MVVGKVSSCVLKSYGRFLSGVWTSYGGKSLFLSVISVMFGRFCNSVRISVLYSSIMCLLWVAIMGTKRVNCIVLL